MDKSETGFELGTNFHIFRFTCETVIQDTVIRAAERWCTTDKKH